MQKVLFYKKIFLKILAAVFMRIGAWLPDKQYLQILYLLRMGRVLHLNNPKTFTEKLQWLKLYDRKPEYTMMVDKFAVKDYVSKIIGEDYIIPTLGVWDKPDDINWEILPNKFVLKTTHGGANQGVLICRDKKNLDKEKACKRLSNSLKQNLYLSQREWPYKGVRHRIIAEKYMEDDKTHELRDYKFFAFNGDVRALFIATDRGSGDVKFDYYDADFNHLDLVQQHLMSGLQIEKPICFNEMKEIASKLSVGLPQVRVDLYEVNGKVYFGEYTFFHHGGIVPFHPESWDYEFGSWINLPEKNKTNRIAS